MADTSLLECGNHDIFTSRLFYAFLADWIRSHRNGWRRHGIGVLQRYLEETPFKDEIRVHIWSSSLELPGIQASGNVHNHRFDLTSTVLVGVLEHVEYKLQPYTDNDARMEGVYVPYDFVHARLHTEETRADMTRIPGLYYTVERQQYMFSRGETYVFKRGAYHSSRPLKHHHTHGWDDLCITVMRKSGEVQDRARVLAPLSKPPVPAFGEPLSEEKIQSVLDRAIYALEQYT